ncbi:protein Aster-B-like isoform X3 [Thrips palmi]|uniref:Protein Aster-B-like isoform X3 n=1 Tax=Thrips palmi TaxID=161013 RepID=A0A6P9A776_THRPL|nr:protein Aster-B-like isoform X3 [Thrips palmi]
MALAARRARSQTDRCDDSPQAYRSKPRCLCRAGRVAFWLFSLPSRVERRKRETQKHRVVLPIADCGLAIMHPPRKKENTCSTNDSRWCDQHHLARGGFGPNRCNDSSGASLSPSHLGKWVKESRTWIKMRRKSVENLLMTGQDVIGSSLTFSTMTLPSLPLQGPSQGLQSQTTGESSPNPSPQPSPRPSPRQQHKRDNQKSDSGSNTKESSPATDRIDVSNTELPKCGKQDNVSRGSDSSQADISRSVSHESGKERKESRGSDRSKKKSSWYNILYPTYKSRSKDFNRIFKDVPPEERLIVDYSCAVAKEILIHGRLYVSQNFLCFYANIFRWETLICLRWKDVTAITKEKTALVIPNAILVCTETEKLFFTSFGARDKAYLMLFRVWQNALMGQQMSMQEMWQWVHACYGQELGLTSEDEDYIEPLPMVEGTSRLSMESFSEDGLVTPEDSLRAEDLKSHITSPVSISDLGNVEKSGTVPSIQTTQPTPPLSTPSSVTSPNNLCVNNPDTQLETDMSDTTESEADKVPDLLGISGGSGQCTSQHEGRQMLRVVLPVSVDQLFTLLFTNSKFFVDFHVSRNSSNIKPSPWTQNAKNERLRTLCLTVNINQAVVGRRQSQITESQVMLKCSKPGKMYAIESESQNAGIPYADSFVIITHYCLNKVSETESSIMVFSDIKYKKSVWVVKGFIEKHTWAGLEEFYSSLDKALQAECCVDEELIAEEEVEVPPKVRRRIRGSARRLSSTRHADEAMVPRSRSSTGRRSLPRGSVGATENCFDSVNSRQVVSSRSNSVEPVNIVILGILVLLLLMNGALYYKLLCFERWSAVDPIPVSLNEDVQSLSKNPPTTQEEWMHLVRKQEALHTLEMQKWQKILQTSVILLRETEDSLKELQLTIQPRVKHKLTSAIKELTNNIDANDHSNS